MNERVESTPDRDALRRGDRRVARRLFFFCLLAYLLLGSGTIPSSDGYTMFTLARSMLSGQLSIPEGNGKVGRNGLLYAKADPGQAVVALPLVATGELTARLLPSGPIRDLWPRSVASTFNAVVGAAAVLGFFLLLRALGCTVQTAVWMSMGLALATPLLPYTKSFMREPLLMLCGIAAFLAIHRSRESTPESAAQGRRATSQRPALAAGLWLGVGMVVKSSFVINVPILLAYLMATSHREMRRRRVAAFLAGPIAGGLLLALYNAHRFGNPLTSGYDPTVDNFSTPLLVGLYGQLLSSGKSIFLYAPLGLVALFAFPAFARRHRPEALTAAALFVTHVIFHAKFASWAGEGSWGPRYLVPVLPFLLLPASEFVAGPRRVARRAAAAALILGLLVQAGGTAIYFGSYMRDLGEYPYERNFSDPLFMYRSHFVPNYSPVVGHWRLLTRNTALLFDAERRPHLGLRSEEAGRLPLSAGDRDELRYVVNFWFCYLIYAGQPATMPLVPLGILLTLTVGAGFRLWSSARAREDRERGALAW